MKYGFVRVAAAVPAVKVADCKFNAQKKFHKERSEKFFSPTHADLFGQTLLLEEAEIALMQIMNNTRG